MATNSYPPLTWNDVHRWAEFGLITPEQLEALKQMSESQSTAQAADEPRTGLNILSIAYYFGAFIILLAYTFFVGIQWQTLGIAGQLGIAFGTIAGLLASGALLKRSGVRLGGDLLIFAGIGITPLAVYTVQHAVGLWPEYDSLAYHDFYRLIRRQWLVIEVISIAAALLALWRTRFSLLMLLVAFWSWYFSMDIARALVGSNDWSWGFAERTAGMAVGLLMLSAGVALDSRKNVDYSFWLYLFGNLILTTHLGSMALEYEGWFGLLFLAGSLVQVAASVMLQRRLFLVFGALGCYGYVSYLAFRVFDGTLGFTFALGAVGLFIVLSAVAYQKLLWPVLARRFGV